MRDTEVAQDMRACADGSADAIKLSCEAPTIRELIEEQIARRASARHAEKLTATVNETVPISDNSPRRRGGAGRKRHGKPGQVDTTSLADMLCDAVGLKRDFPSLIPPRPYCADLASEPGSYYAHEDANLPPPNVIMINPANGRAHSAYLMSVPVARHEMARLDPLRYYAAVERGVARRLDADRCYAGLIAKNPLHPYWRVEWRRDHPYPLQEIADWLFERDLRPDPSVDRTFGAGRNVTIFDDLRSWAYREVRNFKADGRTFEAWYARCIEIAVAFNRQFPQALGISEVRAIAKSVAKWTWKHFSVEKFIAKQTHLSKLGHAKRWAGGSAEKTQPWKNLGISRAQYYRRKKADAL